MLETRQTDVFEKLRREAVEHNIWLPEDASDDLKRAKTGYSLFRFLLNEITKSAKQEAASRNASEDEFAYDVLPEATSIVDDIRMALVQEPYAGDVKATWNFWKHIQHPLYRIQNKDIPYIERSSLESAVARYLNSPFRCVAVDRLLVDALMATEIFAFGDEMWNPYFPSVSPIRQSHALWAYIKGQFWSAAFFGVIIAVTGWLNSRGILGSTGTAWTIGIIIGLFLLLFAHSTIFLPRMWWQQRVLRRRVLKLMQDMIGVYAELQSDGAISADHIRARARKTADDGVKWPPSLFALLDDIIKRTGRF